MSPNVTSNKKMKESHVLGQVHPKPCLVNVEPAIYREFKEKKLVEYKTKREYAYLCTACCRFVPMSRDGETCIKNHRQVLLKFYENELETLKLSSESDRWRVERKRALGDLGNNRIERFPTSSAVKKLFLDEPNPKIPRLETMVIAA